MEPQATDIVTWTDERIEQLRKLWDQGLSASAIGKQLGVSKNAVVGKAHRLKLPARPSPIRKGTRPPVRRMAVLPKPLAAPHPRANPPNLDRPLERLAERPAPERAPVPAPRASAGPVGPTRRAAARGIKSCLWPIGDPGASDFHFCNAEVVPGKSYCAEHCARAYINKSRADSEAA
jgi:GcrA cell cycle regulator